VRLPFEIENSEGLPIRGEVRAPSPGVDRGTVIFCHGFKGFWNWGGFPSALDALAGAGFHAIGFSFSGSGVASGDRVDELERFAENTFTQQRNDLSDVVRAAREGKLPPHGRRADRIGLIGHSMGGGVAILYAAGDSRVGAIVTWAGVSHLDRFPREVVSEWRARGWTTITNARTSQELRMSTAWLDDVERNRESLDILAAARRLTAPLLVIHGEADESVPIAEARAIAEAAGEQAQLRTLPGEGHTFGVAHPFRGTTPGYRIVLTETVSWLRAHPMC
jgi:pimeloyl-ACP methyl ester carboxylesterase